MSDEEGEATHCFAYQGETIYVGLDDEEMTENDLVEAIQEALSLQARPKYYQDSKYQTYVSMKFIMTYKKCVGFDYGSLECILVGANLDLATECDIQKLVLGAQGDDIRHKNNSLRKLTIIAREESFCQTMTELEVIPIATKCLEYGDEDVQTAACGVFWNMGFFDEYKALIGKQKGAISGLVKLLNSRSGSVQRAASGALMNIACDNNVNIKMIADAGAIVPLIKLLESSVLEVKACAAAALRNLAAKEELRKVIAAAGALKGLMSLMKVQNEEVQRGAAGCLAFLAEDPTIREEISRQDAVSVLLPLLTLDTNDEELLAGAARAVAKLALDDTNCLEIAKKGGIPIFIKLLDSKSPKVLTWACNAIYNLAVHDINSKAIGETNAIAILVKLIGSEDYEVRKNAVGALWNLSARDDTALKIASHGGILPLVNRLREEDIEVARRALPCLGNLARQTQLKAEIVDQGVIPHTLRWLKKDKDEIKEHCAFLLQVLCEIEKASSELAKINGLSEVLLNFQKTQNPALRLSLGRALVALCHFEERKIDISNLGGVDIFIELLESQDKETRSIVAKLLSSLSYNDEISLEIGQKGAIPYLMDYLNTKDQIVQQGAFDALANLSSDDENRALIAQYFQFFTLLPFLKSKSIEVQECACRTLLNLTTEDATLKDIIETEGALLEIIELTKSKSIDLQYSATSILKNIASSENFVDYFADNDDAVSATVLVLQNSKDLELTKQALAALVNSSIDDRIAHKISKVDRGVPTIVDLLNSADDDCKGCASVLVCNVARIQSLRYQLGKKSINQLINVTQSQETFSRIHSTAALFYLSQQDSNRIDICINGAVALLNILDKNDEGSRNASWIFEQLATNDECIKEIVKLCPISTLVKFLKSNNSDVKNSMLFVLYKALRADMNLKKDLKEAGVVPFLQEIAKTGEKRSASFADYMIKVIG